MCDKCEKEIEGVYYKPFARLNYDVCLLCHDVSEAAVCVEQFKEGVMLE